MARTASRGNALSRILRAGLNRTRRGPAATTRPRQIVWGVTRGSTFVHGQTIDGFVSEASRVLLDSGRLYRYGDSLVLENSIPGDERLVTVASAMTAEPRAAAALSNLVGTGMRTEESSQEAALAPNLAGLLMADQGLWAEAPRITYHARRPAYGPDYGLCRPGWNPGAGILVHAPAIDPATDLPRVDTSGGAMGRLPRRVRDLLAEFPWAAEADLVNAVGMMLTGLLVNQFIDRPHPAMIVNGNQRGIGKTVLVQAIGRTLDGVEPPRIPLTGDEELGKRLGAEMRGGRTSVLFLDNVRQRIESALLEQNILSPLVSVRQLGHNSTIERPNSYLWAITANQTSATEDFVQRSVVIRLRFEGDPRQRTFARDPVEYAGEHRLAILGELAGMVQRWTEADRPSGPHRHRCQAWAATVGGILAANGLGEWFLADQGDAEAEVDEGVQALAALAEFAAGAGGQQLGVTVGTDPSAAGRPAGEWSGAFDRLGLLPDGFGARNAKAKATWVGNFLAAKIDCRVLIDANGHSAAVLRRREGRGRARLYYFEFHTDLASAHGPYLSSLPQGGGPTCTPTPAAGGALPTVAEGGADRQNELDWG